MTLSDVKQSVLKQQSVVALMHQELEDRKDKFSLALQKIELHSRRLNDHESQFRQKERDLAQMREHVDEVTNGL